MIAHTDKRIIDEHEIKDI